MAVAPPEGEEFRYLTPADGTQSGFSQYGWEKNMRDDVAGMMSYLEVNDARIDFLYNTLGLEEDVSEGHYRQLFEQARGIVDGLA